MILIFPLYNSRIAKFNNVSDITIYIPENYGADTTSVYYIGLKGDVGNQVRFMNYNYNISNDNNS
jgi:hypothetical protein